ncbi:MAG: protein phosphatase 2C domain-containing protein [Deltaproteobacteria bacterium]|nr:protein phosphatase 2C domain-containing protein [Deltaproteobacteria bacterium]
MYVIESAGLTDIGRYRKNNEDALFLDDNQQLYVVADGMGGHQAGEIASGIVVETLWDYIKRFESGEGDVEELEDQDESLSKEANRLLAGIYLANKSVYHTAQEKEDYRGMGSTVSSVYFTENTLIAANVGDSPIYLVHDGSIEMLSVQHTVLAEQAAMDPQGADQLADEFRHMLTRAIGVDENVKADISEIQCFQGDILVIGSDGLTEAIEKEEIHDVVKREKPENACRTLVDLANERGGRDNITVIVLKVKKTNIRPGGFFRFLSKIFR